MHVKHLANLLALVYNLYSPDYNSSELAEGYGWKEYMFCVSLFCFVLFYFKFRVAKGLAIAKCGGI